MSDAIKCDRCGEFEAHAVKQAIVEVNRAVAVDEDGCSRTLTGQDYDLCVSCTKGLYEWLGSPKRFWK